MKNKEKRVIILDNLTSEFISQAIIILKEDAIYKPQDIVAEAERIVSGYFPKETKKSPKKASKLLWGVIFSSVLVIAITLRLILKH